MALFCKKYILRNNKEYTKAFVDFLNQLNTPIQQINIIQSRKNVFFVYYSPTTEKQSGKILCKVFLIGDSEDYANCLPAIFAQLNLSANDFQLIQCHHGSLYIYYQERTTP